MEEAISACLHSFAQTYDLEVKEIEGGLRLEGVGERFIQVTQDESGVLRISANPSAWEEKIRTELQSVASPVIGAAPAVKKTSDGVDNIFDRVMERFGPTMIEVFGHTGTGKSKAAMALALSAAKSGRKVCYIDTEKNVPPDEVALLTELGGTYKLVASLKELKTLTHEELSGMGDFGLIVVDSIGMAGLKAIACTSTKTHTGQVFLDIIAILAKLQEWLFTRDALVYVVNQPESEFGKSEGHELREFGDKARFIPPHVLWSKLDRSTQAISEMTFTAYRSRSFGKGAPVFKVQVTPAETKLMLLA